ncbi:hypothetical protein BCIN_09g00560 [Botrytis cinerea B05.10]|uniref:Transcription factor TFIIIC triple barrel domain-containing protein n=1 Tax=Botryotinia fuckeliana (strain B05.10) TaxID=332648 RepID=A0A384JRP9_BOTFB|nr:hypothetical protein BCIN_09g00560 [Botrytis cinerea B05.10]ATZ53172.1 hypothetical protein BCIN_09g00560 [Botrytis cinerea B05.10]
MADQDGSASAADAPPQNPYSMPMSINVADIAEEEEDEDEYEYEYSTTEKEIFYVTLDLTNPNVPIKRKLVKTHPRRNAKKWLNPGLGKHRRHLGDSTTIVTDKDKSFKAKGKGKGRGKKSPNAEDDEDDDELAEREEEELSEAEAPPPEQVPAEQKPVEAPKKSTGEQYSTFIADTQRGGEASAASKPEVQILGLHEDHPVVSYEGNIYHCRWEENMGTELLFTAHDPQSKLPILQSVSNDVDLLAASSARITSVNTKVEDKDPDSGGKGRSYFWRSGNIRELKIPVGVAASEQRKNQAFFLQSLIQIKESRRERDHVTVMAQRRNTNRQWRAVMKQKQAAEVARIRKAMAAGKMKKADGQQRLDQMAKDAEILAAEDKLRGIGPDGRKIRHGGRKKTVNAENQPILRRPPGGLTNYLMNNAAPEDDDEEEVDMGLDRPPPKTRNSRSYANVEYEDLEADDDGEMDYGAEYEHGEDGEMVPEDEASFEEDYDME